MAQWHHQEIALLRLIECWLPLAQEICTTGGYECTELEDLIRAAAPDLARVSSALAARSVIWHYLVKQQKLSDPAIE